MIGDGNGSRRLAARRVRPIPLDSAPLKWLRKIEEDLAAKCQALQQQRLGLKPYLKAVPRMQTLVTSSASRALSAEDSSIDSRGERLNRRT